MALTNMEERRPNLVSKRERTVEKKKKKRRRREAMITKVWKLNLSMEIMDSSMILIQEILGYGLLGFHLDINLVPFSRVLLGKHSNSRFKGSLGEKP